MARVLTRVQGLLIFDSKRSGCTRYCPLFNRGGRPTWTWHIARNRRGPPTPIDSLSSAAWEARSRLCLRGEKPPLREVGPPEQSQCDLWRRIGTYLASQSSHLNNGSFYNLLATLFSVSIHFCLSYRAFRHFLVLISCIHLVRACCRRASTGGTTVLLAVLYCSTASTAQHGTAQSRTKPQRKYVPIRRSECDNASKQTGLARAGRYYQAFIQHAEIWKQTEESISGQPTTAVDNYSHSAAGVMRDGLAQSRFDLTKIPQQVQNCYLFAFFFVFRTYIHRLVVRPLSWSMELSASASSSVCTYN